MKNIAPDVQLGVGVRIYDFVNLYGCKIGDNSKVGTFVEIQKGANIGKTAKYPAIHSFVKESP
jgi:UDP-3-O-[3-hydroxymyristoyl] glucosamine N-acyltransferase